MLGNPVWSSLSVLAGLSPCWHGTQTSVSCFCTSLQPLHGAACSKAAWLPETKTQPAKASKAQVTTFCHLTQEVTLHQFLLWSLCQKQVCRSSYSHGERITQAQIHRQPSYKPPPLTVEPKIRSFLVLSSYEMNVVSVLYLVQDGFLSHHVQPQIAFH